MFEFDCAVLTLMVERHYFGHQNICTTVGGSTENSSTMFCLVGNQIRINNTVMHKT
uniref:Uncharacterized protein n=1 Tax=Arundo donax TaxID=35708 RepID=A0A0A9ASQ7_ARUDO